MRALPSPPVQLITGEWTGTDDLRARVEAALRGGIRWIQLRAKERSARDIYEAARLLVPLAHDAGALLTINDRADIAVATGADGVHLPENGMSAASVRVLVGGEAWIGRSVHGAAAIGTLDLGDLDAVQLGPVFDTESKRAFGRPLGLAALEADRIALRASGAAALVAVGGIDQSNAASCRRAGADAIAVIGAIWNSDDVEAAARRLCAAFAG